MYSLVFAGYLYILYMYICTERVSVAAGTQNKMVLVFVSDQLGGMQG